MQAPARTAPARVPRDLRDGDLVFRRSPDLSTWVIGAQREGSRFTHVGVVVLSAGAAYVVHAVPPADGERADRGVRVDTLAAFVAPARATDHGFYRPGGLDATQRQVVRDYVLAQRGKAFDERFLYSDDARMFCTEIVLKAFSRAGLAAERDVPRVRVLLHDEGIPTPDDLRRWQGLVALR